MGPLNESHNNLVRFDPRNDTCALFLASALIHFPNSLKDKLIDLVSFNVCPSPPIKSIFSLSMNYINQHLEMISYFFKAHQDIKCKGRKICIVSSSKTSHNLKPLKTHECGEITKPFY